jgi:hypothetical protein
MGMNPKSFIMEQKKSSLPLPPEATNKVIPLFEYALSAIYFIYNTFRPSKTSLEQFASSIKLTIVTQS